MDYEEARRIAAEHFAGRVPESGGWKISGPAEETVMTVTGERPQLVCTFRPSDRKVWQRRTRPPLRVAVDVETGEADMLR